MNSSNFIRLCRLSYKNIGSTPQSYSSFCRPQSNAQLIKNVFASSNVKYFSLNRTAWFKLEMARNTLNGSGIPPSNLVWKPITFTLAFISGTFVTVSIWEYERRASSFRQWFKNKGQARDRELGPYERTKQWWRNLRQSDKIFIPICAINCAVFGLWRFKQIHPLLIRYFGSNPYARAVCTPMVLSMFSHYSLWHLFANMYVLHSFCEPVVNTLGMEQFLFVYLSSGVVSNLSSYLYKMLTMQSGMSLGASGAIMGILAYFCVKYPDHELGIIFLPTVAFSAALGIKCIMGLDLAGCLLRWTFFDHAAHLGGAVFGMTWYYYGQSLWAKREHIKRYWHQLKTPEG